MTELKNAVLIDLILHKLQAIDPYVLLAGGAVRDSYLDIEPNDYDVFLYVPENQPMWSIYKRFEALGMKIVLIGFDGDEISQDYKINPMIRYVFQLIDPELSIKVQIIVLNQPTFKIVDTFPLSICKAWYTPSRGIRLENDFKLTIVTRQIFQTNQLYADGHKYLRKIVDRFKPLGYTFCTNKQSVVDHYINLQINERGYK